MNDNNHLSIQKIYSIILPLIDKLYNEYNYSEITKQEYNAIIMSTISQNINNLENTKSDYLNTYFERYFITNLNEYVTSKMSNEKNSYRIISNYINNNIKLSNDYENCLEQFRKIIRFFNNLNYNPQPDLYINLINSNEIMNNLLKIIIDNNLQQNNIQQIFYGEISNSILEIYCDLNQIDLPENLSRTTTDTQLNEQILNAHYDRDMLQKYYKAISQPLLTKEEEINLFNKKASGDRLARKELIERNLKLVVSIANRYRIDNVPFFDIIEDGNLGLIKAIEKYDVTKNCKFSTYATWWIRREIVNSLKYQSKNVKISNNFFARIHKYREIEKELTIKLGRVPSIGEIAQELGLNINDVILIKDILKDTISLNENIKEDADETLIDFIASNDDVEQDAIDSISNRNLICLLKNNLSPKEFNILTMSFGLNGSNRYTDNAIGKKLGVTRQYINLVKQRALLKAKRMLDDENNNDILPKIKSKKRNEV